MTSASKIPSATPSFAILVFSSSVEVRSDLQRSFLQSFAWATILPAIFANTVTNAHALKPQLFVFVCQVLRTHKFMAFHSASYQKMIPATLSHESCFQLFVHYL